MKIDTIFNQIPSRIINAITLGSKGSSLCGRLYLYKFYISDKNVLVNTLMFCIDSIEKDHCETSAKFWRIRHKKEGCYFPKRYINYL